jgi:hypothetical protein
LALQWASAESKLAVVHVTTAVGFLAAAMLLSLGSSPDPMRNAWPPPSPKPVRPPGTTLFFDDFSRGTLEGWKADRPDVWTVRRAVLKAELPDERQQRSFLYTGSEAWTDYAVDLDVCGMRGVDKGVLVRVVEGRSGIGVDLRGPGYQDALLHRREWPLGKASVINANTQWHHLRIEARGHRYRVWVNGAVLLDKEDSRRSRPAGGIALAAYSGGVGECTVYYDNIVVTALGADGGTSVGASK